MRRGGGELSKLWTLQSLPSKNRLDSTFLAGKISQAPGIFLFIRSTTHVCLLAAMTLQHPPPECLDSDQDAQFMARRSDAEEFSAVYCGLSRCSSRCGDERTHSTSISKIGLMMLSQQAPKPPHTTPSCSPGNLFTLLFSQSSKSCLTRQPVPHSTHSPSPYQISPKTNKKKSNPP